MKSIKFQISRILLLSGMFIFSIATYAEVNGVIKGRVLDNNSQPIQYATATLIDPETNQIVVGDMCDNNGEYILENVKQGKYILSVRNVGFEKNESANIVIDSNKNQLELNPTILNQSVNELKEIKVFGKKKVNGVIKGRVLDKNKQPIPFATATLIDPKTNRVVVGDMCDDNGEYILENVKHGKYILSIRNVGFEKNESNKLVINSTKNQVELKPIILNESVYRLSEIEVIGKKNITAQASNNIGNKNTEFRAITSL